MEAEVKLGLEPVPSNSSSRTVSSLQDTVHPMLSRETRGKPQRTVMALRTPAPQIRYLSKLNDTLRRENVRSGRCRRGALTSSLSPEAGREALV